MTTVFVYGTLKRGGPNHIYLTGQEFLGSVRTAPGYTLYSLGDYPGMVRAPGEASGVTGELWSVNDCCLVELDRLEGVDESLYERIEVELAPNAHAASAQTYLYLRAHQGLPPAGDTWSVQRP